MWISSEDARSDFILTAAALFLGSQVAAWLNQALVLVIPGIGGMEMVQAVITLFWLLVIGSGAAFALARHRSAIPEVFGLGAANSGSASSGVVLATPLVVGHVMAALLTGDSTAAMRALGGRFLATNGPQMAPNSFLGLEQVVWIVAVVFISLGCWLTVTFMATRAQDAFRSPDADLTGLLRTWGLGGVAATFLLGMMNALRLGGGYAQVAILAAVLAIIVLLADMYVPPAISLPRMGVLAPAIAITVLWVLSLGGPFRGDLVTSLFHGAAAWVIVVVAGALIHARHGVAAATLLAAGAIYPVTGSALQALPLPVG